MHRTGSYASAFEDIATSVGNVIRAVQGARNNSKEHAAGPNAVPQPRCSHRGINRQSMKLKFGRINDALQLRRRQQQQSVSLVAEARARTCAGYHDI